MNTVCGLKISRGFRVLSIIGKVCSEGNVVQLGVLSLFTFLSI